MALGSPNHRFSPFSRPQPPNPDEPQAAPNAESPTEPNHQPPPPASADFDYLSDLQPLPVDWLWHHRLAAGTLAMLSGEPGTGKTFIALSIAAALSRGHAPYSGEPLKPCTTLYASAEHSAAEVIHPRFAALNGDPARLVVLRESLATLPANTLQDALARTQARLLILDPLEISAATGLTHLAHLAQHHHCCILLLRHLRKRSPGRPAPISHGVPDLTTALRTEFLAGASPDAPAHPALLHIKSNLGPLAPPLAYTIDPTDGFDWTGPSQLTPEELLAQRPTGAGLFKRKFAGEWLRQYLQDGAHSQYSIEVAAQRDGVCIATLKRAKFDLGVLSAKDGQSGPWTWSLPTNPAN